MLKQPTNTPSAYVADLGDADCRRPGMTPLAQCARSGGAR